MSTQYSVAESVIVDLYPAWAAIRSWTAELKYFEQKVIIRQE